MKIPMVNLQRGRESLRKEIDEAVKRVLDNCNFILGSEVSDFEKNFASFTGAAAAAGVASGTDALRLAILASEIKPGDEVITTPFTFIATSETITQAGAVPVFADIEEDTYNISPRDIENKITPGTKAIICVHLYGHPCDMDKIMDIARKHELTVIEDCAQSFTARYNLKGKEWKHTGTIGRCGTFSFFPAKNLGAFGDAGLVLSGDESLINEVRILRNHGSGRPYFYEREGFNSRLDTLQAAILRVKLGRIEKWTAMRNEAARKYSQRLEGLCKTPVIRGNCEHSFNYYTVRFDSMEKRDKVKSRLLEKDIACQIYYPVALHLQKAYSGLKTPSLKTTEKVAGKVLSLPMFPELTEDEIDLVTEEIKEALK